MGFTEDEVILKAKFQEYNAAVANKETAAKSAAATQTSTEEQRKRARAAAVQAFRAAELEKRTKAAAKAALVGKTTGDDGASAKRQNTASLQQEAQAGAKRTPQSTSRVTKQPSDRGGAVATAKASNNPVKAADENDRGHSSTQVPARIVRHHGGRPAASCSQGSEKACAAAPATSRASGASKAKAAPAIEADDSEEEEDGELRAPVVYEDI